MNACLICNRHDASLAGIIGGHRDSETYVGNLCGGHRLLFPFGTLLPFLLCDFSFKSLFEYFCADLEVTYVLLLVEDIERLEVFDLRSD